MNYEKLRKIGLGLFLAGWLSVPVLGFLLGDLPQPFFQLAGYTFMVIGFLGFSMYAFALWKLWRGS